VVSSRIQLKTSRSRFLSCRRVPLVMALVGGAAIELRERVGLGPLAGPAVIPWMQGGPACVIARTLAPNDWRIACSTAPNWLDARLTSCRRGAPQGEGGDQTRRDVVRAPPRFGSRPLTCIAPCAAGRFSML